MSESNSQSNVSVLQLAEVFVEPLSQLAIEDISSVIKSDYGYHLFKLIAITLPTADEISEFESSFKDWEEGLLLEAEKLSLMTVLTSCICNGKRKQL